MGKNHLRIDDYSKKVFQVEKQAERDLRDQIRPRLLLDLGMDWNIWLGCKKKPKSLLCGFGRIYFARDVKAYFNQVINVFLRKNCRLNFD